MCLLMGFRRERDEGYGGRVPKLMREKGWVTNKNTNVGGYGLMNQ